MYLPTCSYVSGWLKVQAHFPNIMELAQKQANTVKDPELLQSLILKLFAAHTEEEATQILRAVNPRQKKKKQ